MTGRRHRSRAVRGLGVPALIFAALVSVGCAYGPPSRAEVSPTAGAPQDAPVSQPVSQELAVQTFDSAWSRINASYYDPDFRGIDWAGVRDELRPSVEGVTTRDELRSILRDMLSRLGESHFAIIPEERVDAIDVDEDGSSGAETSGTGDVGVEVRWVEGALTVFRVRPGPAADAGVEAGWTVEKIGDRSTDRWAEVIAESEAGRERVAVAFETMQGAASLMSGAVGSTVEMTLRDGAGQSHDITLERSPVRGQLVQFGALPPIPSYLEYRRVERGGDCVGVIEFNIWMIPLVASFNEAVDALADCQGMVIDLRGNLGGVGGMVMVTAGSFFGERAELGKVQSRAGELNFVAMPRQVDTSGELRDAFEGPLALLVDELSVSTSEIFAAGLRSTGRARIFGQTTPGYALPAMTLRLPTGDVLYHVVSNLTDPDGQRIEGAGVVPDQQIPLRRATLLEGRDEVLEAAVAWALTSGGGP